MPARFASRPLEDAERRALPPPRRFYWLWSLPWPLVHFVFYLLIAWLAFAAFGSLLFAALEKAGLPLGRLPETAALVIGITIYAALTVIPGWLVYRRWRRDTRCDRERARDLREGRVDVIHVDDANLAALPGLLEGSFLLCDLGEGRSLLLDRERMRVLCAAPASPVNHAAETSGAPPVAGFPCRSFVLHRLPHSGRSLRLHALGSPCGLPPVPERLALHASDLAAFRENPDCDALVLPRAFSELVPDLAALTDRG